MSNEPSARQIILEAAIKIFAKNGFYRASTNDISAASGFSKGLIFHYFKSKRSLYGACVEFVSDKIKVMLGNSEIMDEADIFKKLFTIGLFKQRLFSEHKDYLMLLTRAQLGAEHGDFPELGEMLKTLSETAYASFTAEMDFSRIRTGIDHALAKSYIYEIMQWYSGTVLKRFKNDVEEAFRNINDIMQEFQELEEIMKYGLYKREI